MRVAVDHLFREGQLVAWGFQQRVFWWRHCSLAAPTTDLIEAEAAITRFADAPADDGLVIRDIWLMRLRALLARAHGDETAISRTMLGPLL